MTDAKDIFGEEPEDDNISDSPSMVDLSTPIDIEDQIKKAMFRKAGNPASEKQVNYILGLMDQHQLPPYFKDKELIDRLDAEAVEKAEASQIIDQLKTFPRKTNGPYPFVKPTPEELPAGHYAIDDEHGDTKFYQVWRATKYGKPDIIKVYLQHGPDDSEVPFRTAMLICRRIVASGPYECAVRYGKEIGACCICGRRLTNRTSRELGIGPVCGGRFFVDRISEWETLRTDAVNAILARGEDPNEEIVIEAKQ